MSSNVATWPRASAPPLQHSAAQGERLELPRGVLWTLQRGEVVVQVHGRPVDVWRAPRPVDVLQSLGESVGVSLIAATEVALSGEPLTHVDSDTLCRALQVESRALWARVDADARRDDDTFLTWARPVPGPWHFRDMTARLLVVQGDPDRLRACLPRRVALLPGTQGRYLISVARFEGVGSLDPRAPGRFAYHEVTPFVPVWSGRRGPAAFVPELYPDAWMAVLLGQMIHGFPKRTARVGFHEDGADLLVDRRHALRLRFDDTRGEPPSEALGAIVARLVGREGVAGPVAAVAHRLREHLSFSTLVHKRVPDAASAGRRLAIDELVRVPVRLDPVRSARRLCGLQLDLPGGPGILHGRVLAGWELEAGFRFGAGHHERRARSAP